MAKKKLACAKCGGAKKMQKGGGTKATVDRIKKGALALNPSKGFEGYRNNARLNENYSDQPEMHPMTISKRNTSISGAPVPIYFDPSKSRQKKGGDVKKKMQKGGSVSGGSRSAKALMENMGTSGQYGKMQKGGEKKAVKAAVKDSRIAEKAQKAFNKQMNTPAQKSGTYKRLGKKVKRLTSKLK